MFPIHMRTLYNISVRQTYLGKLDSGRGVGDIFSFKIKLGFYEKFAKTKPLFYETFGLRSKIAGVTCTFVNERHGPLL